MNKVYVVFLSAVLLLSLTNVLRAFGEEQIGNEPLHEISYQDWPAIMPAINHASRVYHNWVNGHERFYFKGSVKVLNDFLVEFSGAKPRVEVLICPALSSNIKTFGGIDIPYDWSLELVGGITKHLTTEDLGGRIWSPNPMLRVYISDANTLKRLKIPRGINLLEPADLKRRYIEGLSSKHQSVRGWGSGRLANLDPYDSNSIDIIAKLLDDDEWWVRLCAIGALQTFGQRARSVIPQIQVCADTEQKRLRDRVTEAIESIQSANANEMKANKHNEMLILIHRYAEECHRKSGGQS